MEQSCIEQNLPSSLLIELTSGILIKISVTRSTWIRNPRRGVGAAWGTGRDAGVAASRVLYARLLARLQNTRRAAHSSVRFTSQLPAPPQHRCPPTSLAGPMPPDCRPKHHLKFFKDSQNPETSGLRAYLRSDHGDMTPQESIDNWKKSLVAIARHPDDAVFGKIYRERAAALLERFNGKVRPFASSEDCNRRRRAMGLGSAITPSITDDIYLDPTSFWMRHSRITDQQAIGLLSGSADGPGARRPGYLPSSSIRDGRPVRSIVKLFASLCISRSAVAVNLATC